MDVRTRAAALLGAALVVPLVAACSGASSPGSAGSSAATANVEIIDTLAAFTAKTLVDWKSLGDAIAIVDITDSHADNSAAGDPTENGGTYGRIADVMVDDVLWERDDTTHALPTRFSMRVWGWVAHGNAQQAIVARGEPRLETGNTYLIAFAKFKTGWAPLGDGAEVPFDNGVVGQGEWAGRDPKDKQPAITALLGKNAAQVKQIVDETVPTPQSLEYGDLDPLTRAKKVGASS